MFVLITYDVTSPHPQALKDCVKWPSYVKIMVNAYKILFLNAS